MTEWVVFTGRPMQLSSQQKTDCLLPWSAWQFFLTGRWRHFTTNSILLLPTSLAPSLSLFLLLCPLRFHTCVWVQVSKIKLFVARSNVEKRYEACKSIRHPIFIQNILLLALPQNCSKYRETFWLKIPQTSDQKTLLVLTLHSPSRFLLSSLFLTVRGAVL